MSAQIIKFPRNRIFRTKKDRKLLVRFYENAVKAHPEWGSHRHFIVAMIALSVSKKASKRDRRAAT